MPWIAHGNPMISMSRRRRSPSFAATACEAVARMIGATIERADRALLAGGGARNAALAAAIARHSRVPPQSTAAFGIPPNYREAIAMAILGALCQDRIPITLPAITRVSSPPPISGSWVLP